MTKSEFLGQLERELKQNNVPDIREIVGEYESHFAFKLADGFPEEEIAAKLGIPAEIAAQFGAGTVEKGRAGGKAIAGVGLCVSGIAAGIFFVLLTAWGVVLAAFSLCSAAIAVSLITGINPWALVPFMPYGSAVIIGIAAAALAVLSAVGCIWFAAFLRQMTRVYGRFHHNTMAAATGKPILPSIAVSPNFQPKFKRCLRRVALVALMVFAVCFVLGLAVSMICSGSLEFWHTWGWFGNAA